MVLLLKSTKQNVPSRIVNLRGPRWKASPTVRSLLEHTTLTYRIWNQHGRPNDQLKKGKNNAQNQLRKQLRKEHFNDRQNLCHQIMENPSTDLFYKLTKRNRGGAKQETACICLNGQDYYDTCEQRKLLVYV